MPELRPPGERWPQRALTSGLLLSPGEADAAYTLWDPVMQTVLRRLPGRAIGEHGPAYGDVLASRPAPCRWLRLTDVHTGGRRDVALS